MKRMAAVIASAVVVSSVAFAGGDKGGTKGTGGAGQHGMTGKSAAMMMPKDEKSFAEKMHHTNQMEIRLGQLAEQKAQSDSVKQFARMMVQDHQQADQQLMQLAQQQKWKLSDKPKGDNQLERAMMESHKAMEAKLRALDGPAFDAAYMAAMVDDHNMNVMKVGMAQQQFQTGPMSQMLTQMLPKLQQHRDHAMRVLGEVKVDPNAMAIGGAGTTGTKSGTGSSGSMGTGTGGTGTIGTGTDTGTTGGTGGSGTGTMDNGTGGTGTMDDMQHDMGTGTETDSGMQQNR